MPRISDHDLPAEPATADERATVLLRRCLAYAAGCLRAARDAFGDDAVRAYVSLSPGGLDEELKDGGGGGGAVPGMGTQGDRYLRARDENLRRGAVRLFGVEK